MEHIIISERTLEAAPLIPNIGSEPWDELPFINYMARKGWSFAYLTDSDHKHKSETEILDFLQTWLFFGLLAELCGWMGHRVLFTRLTESGAHVVCTKNLRAACKHGKRRRCLESREEFENWQTQLVQCLNKAFDVLTASAAAKMSYLSSPVIFGIAALCDFTKSTALSDTARSRCFKLPNDTSLLLRRRMEAIGWCPTNVQRLSFESDIASLLLVGAQPHPDPDKTHSTCDNKKCHAYQVDEKEYQRSHSPNCRGDHCRDLIVERDRLHTVLSSGSIALTKVVKEGSSGSQIQVLRADSGTRYIAISHVWSDGYGNPHENGLFLCQVERIAGWVRSLMGFNAPFWIDTLSCPVAPPEATDLAISMMRETYADAEKVLVLNSHLLSRDMPGSALEVLSLIISSSWTRRLWTLQEGELAKELVFQFGNDSIELGRALWLAECERRDLVGSDSLEYINIMTMPLPLQYRWKFDVQPSRTLVLDVHAALQWRSTSVATDEPLCISALLGIPLGEIMSADISHRNAQLWRLIHNPSKLVLFWCGERQRDLGLRWAPESLLGESDSYFLMTESPGFSKPHDSELTRLTDDGLVLRSNGISLGEWTVDIPSGFVIYGKNGLRLWVSRQDEARGKTQARLLTSLSLNESSGLTKQLSLFLQRSIQESLIEDPRKSVPALIVSHYTKDQTTIKATIEDVCYVFNDFFDDVLGRGGKVWNDMHEKCMEAFEKADRCAAWAHIPLSPSLVAVVTRLGIETEMGNNVSRIDTLDPRGYSVSGHVHLRVFGDAEGFRKIERNAKLWWTECSLLPSHQEWCLD